MPDDIARPSCSRPTFISWRKGVVYPGARAWRPVRRRASQAPDRRLRRVARHAFREHGPVLKLDGCRSRLPRLADPWYPRQRELQLALHGEADQDFQLVRRQVAET